MRICILVAGLPPLYNGGTEIATIQIARHAANYWNEVHIIALDGTEKGNVYSKQYKTDVFKVHRVTTLPVSYLYGLVALPSVVYRVWRLKPDVIHAQGFQMGISAFVTSLITKIPYIVYGRGEIYVNWFCKSFISRLLMKYASRVIAQTEHMKTEMLKYYNRDIEVIQNGIDVKQFGQVDKIEARKKLWLPLDKKIVIWVGNNRPEKNLQCFIDASHLFAGDTHSRIVIKRNYDEVKLWMCAADILVNTSYSEGFPMTLLEGMASGLAIIAPKVCGIPEIMTDGLNGFLFESGNYIEVAQCVNFLVAHEDILNNMAVENKKRAKCYQWDSIVTKLYVEKK